MIMLSKPTG